jgi:hypothetical protein
MPVRVGISTAFNGPQYGAGGFLAVGGKVFGDAKVSIWNHDNAKQIALSGGWEPGRRSGRRWSACPILTVAGAIFDVAYRTPLPAFGVYPGVNLGFEVNELDESSTWATIGLRLAHAVVRQNLGYYADCPWTDFFVGIPCNTPPTWHQRSESPTFGVLTAGVGVIGNPISARMGLWLPTYRNQESLLENSPLVSAVVTFDLVVGIPR